MNIKYKILLGAIALVITCAGCYAFYYYTDNRVETATIEYIKSMQKSPNEFLDIANDINVSSADDVGFIVRGRYSIDICYGDQIIRMTKKCFESDEYKQMLSEIGIEVKFKVDPNDAGNIKYRVTYWGDVVKELSLVS